MDNTAAVSDLVAAIADRDEIIEDLRAQLGALLNARDTDELTGLYNLRWLRQFWDREHARVGAVAFVDVDKLKRINDTYGHSVGDRVITHVASAIASSGCYGIRYGGDEFLILIPDGWDVHKVIGQLTKQVETQPVQAREEITVTISVGVRTITAARTLRELIGDADRLMYEVKRSPESSGGYRVDR